MIAKLQYPTQYDLSALEAAMYVAILRDHLAADYDKVNELVESGVEKAEAFKQLSATLNRPYDSVRGSYYSHKTKIEGGGSRPRTRVTRSRHSGKRASGTPLDSARV
jgi:hypothetical protein